MHLSSFISSITEPMVIFLALALFGGIHAGLTGVGLHAYIAYLIFLTIGIWVVRIRLTAKLHTNWDASDRKKRVPLLFVLLGFSVILFGSLMFWRTPALTHMGVASFFWLLGFFLITLRVKISGHLAVFILALGYFISWYGLRVAVGLVLVPLLAWSRLVLKRHTPVEVIGGILYSGAFHILLRVIGSS